MPLPWLEAEGYFATDAWLVLNDQQIHAYNQDADYKPMPVAWWDQSEAQLLLQISGKRRAQPSPLAHQIHGSEWAFFKLLDRAEKSADVWRWYWDWSVPGEVPGGRIRVRYQMDNDPRGAFRFDLDSPMVSRGGR